MPRSSRHLRRGSIYMAVLSAALIVTVIGLSSIAVVRVQRRAAEGTSDFSQARLYAQSGVEMGLLWIDTDPDWRNTYPNGEWVSNVPIGNGRFSLEGIDPGDGDLTNSDMDPLLLTGIGFKGDARYKLQVTLMPQLRGLDCLEVALDAGGDLTFSSTLTCDQTVSANDDILGSDASGTSDLEAVDQIDPGAIVGTQTTLSMPRTLPDSTVFDYYIANGTAIDINAMPTAGGKPVIDDVVISPASNPYPPYNTNGQGIYIIDCAGQDIYMHGCRIVGTLVLLNPGSGSALGRSNAVNWEPAVPNYPALLVSGNHIKISIVSSVLYETSGTGSFNPPGTPYDGVADTDTTDSYPSVIKGLVYVSGDLTISTNSAVFDGVVVVGGSLDASGDMSLTYQPTFLNDPPPGFAEPPMMVISPGSWRQVVD